MKRVLLLSALMLSLGVRPAWAGADPKVVSFLKKLDLYYYCPGREGLKGFTCDLRITTSPVYKEDLRELGCDSRILAALDGNRIRLTVHVGGKKNLEVILPRETADADFNAQLKEQLFQVAKNLEKVIDNLDSDVFMPIFGENNFKQDLKVTNGADGFTLRENSKDGSVVETDFDRGARMTRLVASKNGEMLLDMDADYSPGPQGFMLNAYTVSSPKMDLTETDHFEYGKVGKYFLPVRIVKEFQWGKMFQPGTAITVDCSNYRLEESPPGKRP